MQLTSVSLRSLIPLVEKRDALIAEIATVEAEIALAWDGQGPPASPVKRTYTKRTKGKRGAVRELILAALKEAGEAGIAVKHLAPKIGLKPQNIHVWLHTSGKKSGLIKALGKGVYRLEEAMGAAPAPAELQAPKPKVTAKAKAPKAPKAAKASKPAKAPKAAPKKAKKAPRAKKAPAKK